MPGRWGQPRLCLLCRCFYRRLLLASRWPSLPLIWWDHTCASTYPLHHGYVGAHPCFLVCLAYVPSCVSATMRATSGTSPIHVAISATSTVIEASSLGLASMRSSSTSSLCPPLCLPPRHRPHCHSLLQRWVLIRVLVWRGARYTQAISHCPFHH